MPAKPKISTSELLVGNYPKSSVKLKPTEKEILRETMKKLENKEELFPESNQRVRDMIENSNIKQIMKGKVMKTVDDKWAVEFQSDLHGFGVGHGDTILIELVLNPNDSIWIGKEVEVETIEYSAHTFLPSKVRLVTTKEKEMVNGPQHYGGKDNPYEVIKVCEAWELDQDAYLFNVVKYVARAGKKDKTKEIEDLKKAAFYLDRKIKNLEK
jgi:hypothetical protein